MNEKEPNSGAPRPSAFERKVATYITEGKSAIPLKELGSEFMSAAEALIRRQYKGVQLQLEDMVVIPEGAEMFVVIDDRTQEVVATIACIDGRKVTLPIYDLYKAEIDEFLTTEGLAESVDGFELGRLATSGESPDYLPRLFAASVAYVLGETKGTSKKPYFFITVHPDHERPYTKIFGFSRVTDMQKKHAVGQSSVALYLDVQKWAERNNVLPG